MNKSALESQVPPHVRRTKMMFNELVKRSGHDSGSGDMCHQIKHVRFFEKMSFSQPWGPPEKVEGHIFM